MMTRDLSWADAEILLPTSTTSGSLGNMTKLIFVPYVVRIIVSAHRVRQMLHVQLD